MDHGHGARSLRGWLDGVELDRLPDEAYFPRMRACGSRVRQWDDRYIGLPAGAAARDLPRRRGFRDIHHMAALQARMSRKKVAAVQRIARAVDDGARAKDGGAPADDAPSMPAEDR